MKRFLVVMMCVWGLLWLCGCEGSGGSGDGSAAPAAGLESGDSASLSFRVEWVDEVETLVGAVKLSDDCSARGVANVRLSVRDSSGASLKSETFACSARQGTLTGVTPGSNRIIRVSGLTSSGTETWRGEKRGVNLAAGDNNVGTIQVERVNNHSPTAAISSPSNNSTYTQGQSITFTGTGTDPEDGTLSSSTFTWTSSRDGQIWSGAKSFSISSLSTGTHTITLTVTDSDGAAGSKSITVIIRAPNQSPTAAITSPANNTAYTYGDIVSFVGTGTDPEDGTLASSSFVWTSSREGEIQSGRKSFSTSSLSTGTHTITLTLTDSDGATGSKTITVTIKAPNQSPAAAITIPANNSAYTYGDIVSFVGTGTDLEDGDILGSRFVWASNRDGQIRTGVKSFSISSLSVGTHTITLTMTDSDGAAGTATLNIIINQSNPGGTITNSLGMTFVKINPGTFMMGSPTDEPGRNYSNEILYQVTLTKGYYLQTTEVTQGQWKAVMGFNPSSSSDCGDNCPVETVSWNDVQEFISAMNRRGEGTYRLPTEAEWEYAARAGTTTPFSFGNCLSTSQANYNGNYPYTGCSSGTYRETPVAVGTLGKNAWGLYDMHGNVWEWCSDWHDRRSYSSSVVTDPTGPSSGSSRVRRGGSWNSRAQYCRSAYRGGYIPAHRSDNAGFRLARTL